MMHCEMCDNFILDDNYYTFYSRMDAYMTTCPDCGEVALVSRTWERVKLYSIDQTTVLVSNHTFLNPPRVYKRYHIEYSPSPQGRIPGNPYRVTLKPRGHSDQQ